MNITLISTVHQEMGKCNANELCEIIEKIRPEVIFLEALDETYSNYDKSRFRDFGVHHKKLEIKAIQEYCSNASFTYVPVLENELPESFDKKNKVVGENKKLQMLVEDFNSLAREYGFKFLNSAESIKRHEEMRMLERRLLKGGELSNTADEDLDEYENSMLRNIYSYCKSNEFNIAIFMCGSAHRKSIMEKIEKLKVQEETNLSWTIFQPQLRIGFELVAPS